ncbi:MAG: hypothetical protein KBG29_00760 [Pseudomonadales bacterium]|jgi:hypothetical protein|nr:hypothetical protein [Pseudomonadales bacterium]MBP9129969.1 hypothetical protein [Steroidobacteraceae bacterium]
MKKQRRSDKGAAVVYQTNRFFEKDGRWYFLTREEGMKGPFPDRQAAEEMAEAYSKAMGSPFRPSAELSLLPLDD